MRTIFLGLTLLCFAAPMTELNAQQSTTPLDAPEKLRIMQAIDRAIEAGRHEADDARTDMGLPEDDRRHAQAQFALMLMRADRCAEASRFVRDREEIMAGSIELLLFGIPVQEDPSCVAALATIMIGRWNDPLFTPAGRIALRHKAAAYLDAVDMPDGKAAMNAAERELFELGSGASDSLWRARREALGIYRGSPKQMSYLEEISPKMRSEGQLIGISEGNGLLTIMAGLGRCDLVENHVGNGPKSCDEYIEWSKPVIPSEPLERRFAFDPPRLTDQGIDDALSHKTPWLRLTHLVRLVSAGSRALKEGMDPGNRPDPTQ